MQKISALANKQPSRPYTLKKGLTYYKHRVFIPSDSNVIQQLLQAYHDSPKAYTIVLLAFHEKDST